MDNNRIDKFDVFSDTSRGGEDIYRAWCSWRDGEDGDSFDGTMEGDLQVVERFTVEPAHRRHGLGLFMLEAADNVINGHMSMQVLKPFPLQFERSSLAAGNNYGFPGTGAGEAAIKPLRPPRSVPTTVDSGLSRRDSSCAGAVGSGLGGGRTPLGRP
jgi:hypothetical protein